MRKRGFTLIELLVVIAIIGLLATLSVVSFSTSRDKARIAKGAGLGGQILRALGDDLVARWDFDECVGPSFYDASGYNNNGALGAGISFSSSTPSGNGCSLRLDGTGQVTIASPSLSMRQTKTMWVYIVGAVSGNQYLIDEGVNHNTIQIYSGRVLFSENMSATGYFTSNASVVTGKWYFIALTHNGSEMSLYVDGSLDKKQTVVGAAPPGPITIGNYGGGGAYRLNGYLDEVHLFNRELSASEIRHLYAEGVRTHLALD